MISLSFRRSLSKINDLACLRLAVLAATYRFNSSNFAAKIRHHCGRFYIKAFICQFGASFFHVCAIPVAGVSVLTTGTTGNLAYGSGKQVRAPNSPIAVGTQGLAHATD